MKHTIQILLLATAVAFASACGGSQPVFHSKTSPDADFDHYSTIALASNDETPDGYHRAELPDNLKESGRDAARKEILSRGWTGAPVAEADVLLRVGVGRRTDTARLTQNSHFAASVELYEVDIDSGTLVVEAFDRKTNELVWHGHIRGRVEGEVTPEEFAGAIHQLFADFPNAGSPAETSSGSEAPAEANDTLAE